MTGWVYTENSAKQRRCQDPKPEDKTIEKECSACCWRPLLAIGMLPSAFAGYENFNAQAIYTAGQFTDVPETAWYAQNVPYCL